MKKRYMMLASLCLSASLLMTGPGTILAGAEETAESSEAQIKGELAFARCDEYINIRNGANTDSEITAKIYNNGAVTILGRNGDWYEITSGNARGYVKSEYFVTGEEAQKIAEKVAYNVATVYPEHLNIRSGPSEDYGLVDVAGQYEELEVVAYDGDWMKVALGNDVYGYVNAYYVGYDTYYPVAETLEEEQIRLREEQEAAEAAWAEVQAEENWSEDSGSTEDTWYEEPGNTEDNWTEDYGSTEDNWTEDNGSTEDSWTEDDWTEDSGSAEDSWTEDNWTEDSGSAEDSWTEDNWTEDSWTEDNWTEDSWTEDSWTEDSGSTEDNWTEENGSTDDSWSEDNGSTDDSWSEDNENTEDDWSEDSSEQEQPAVSLGTDIANFATQFVGNPYVWGGTSLTNGADCSGFAQSVMANFGIYISRTAASQSYGGTPVSMDNIQAGDLVFYSSGGGIDHVALYIGGGQIVHAANSNSGIIISDCYYNTPVSVRRYW